MGQIKVEKNVGGIEGLCVIEPAVHGDLSISHLSSENSEYELSESKLIRILCTV